MTRLGVAMAGVLGLAGLVSVPATAAHQRHHATSHHSTRHHATTRHHGSPGRSSKAQAHETPKLTAHAEKTLKGVLSVPAGGVKLFCGPGRGPLLVRKMTQGSGTTVTVICR